MNFLFLLTLQIVSAFKFEPEGFKLKEVHTVRSSERLFPFKLTDFDAAHTFEVNIKATCQEDAQKVYTVNISGTPEVVNSELKNQKLPLVTSHTENYVATAFIKDKDSGKEVKFDYKFKALPHIEVEDLWEKTKEAITYPFKAFKISDKFNKKNLELNIEQSSPDTELIHNDGYIVFNSKPDTNFTDIKFHLFDKETNQRSADLYLRKPTVIHTKTTSSRRIFYYLSLALVLILLVVIIYHYAKPKKTVRYEPERPTMPGFSSSNVPRHISLPVDAPIYTNNILDLKDAHNK